MIIINKEGTKALYDFLISNHKSLNEENLTEPIQLEWENKIIENQIFNGIASVEIDCLNTKNGKIAVLELDNDMYYEFDHSNIFEVIEKPL